MATRRPNVPRAQFPSGAAKGTAAGTPAPGGPAGSSAPPAGSSSSAPGSVPAPGAPSPNGARADHGSPGRGRAGGRAATWAAWAGLGGKRGNGERFPGERAETTPIPARTFSGKLLAIGVVLLALTLLLAPNVGTYFRQRAEIAALQDDIAAKQAEQSSLARELARWDDPAYVRQQARDRVSMLMPGETGYWVYGAQGLSTGAAGTADGGTSAGGTANGTGSAAGAAGLPWVAGLWQSILESAAPQAATPARPASPAAP